MLQTRHPGLMDMTGNRGMVKKQGRGQFQVSILLFLLFIMVRPVQTSRII